MSVELEVLPTVAQPVTWGALKQQLFSNPLGDAVRAFVGDQPSLRDVENDRLAADGDALAPGDRWTFDLQGRHSLGLAVYANAEDYTDEAELLDEFAVNLDEDTRFRIAAAWRQAGYSFNVTSYINPHPQEYALLLALAGALADLCAGYVLVKDGERLVEDGLHPASAFRSLLAEVREKSGDEIGDASGPHEG